jgi:alcohol dehydrogenase, propanol-preferring
MADATYRAIQVAPSGELELTERPLLEPSAGQVRLRVEACGICATDARPVHPHPATEPGVVPGHEVAGVIDAIDAGVTGWTVGDRAGVGFLAGHCGYCDACRHGDFVRCANQTQHGIGVDGGYAEYITVRANALVAIPDELTSLEAAPLLCAGLTPYNGLLRGNVLPGSTVAIQGLGGLGHLAVQYAAAMGMNTIAIARGDKSVVAGELGADHYVDGADPRVAVRALQALGGAHLILTTVASGASSSGLIEGLTGNGKLVVVGASPDPVTVPTGALIEGGVRILGNLTGTPVQNEENLRFAVTTGVRPVIETRSLADAPAAFARMVAGRARFRMVLVP